MRLGLWSDSFSYVILSGGVVAVSAPGYETDKVGEVILLGQLLLGQDTSVQTAQSSNRCALDQPEGKDSWKQESQGEVLWPMLCRSN